MKAPQARRCELDRDDHSLVLGAAHLEGLLQVAPLAAARVEQQLGAATNLALFRSFGPHLEVCCEGRGLKGRVDEIPIDRSFLWQGSGSRALVQ